MAYPKTAQWYHCNSSKPKKVEIADLPKITPHFRYQQAIRLGSYIGAGVITFSQQDFYAVLADRLGCGSDADIHSFDRELLEWVVDVDHGASQPCLLPIAWSGIEGLLLELIIVGKYSAYCLDCARSYPPTDAVSSPVTDGGRTSFTFYAGITCPREHILFQTEVLHGLH